MATDTQIKTATFYSRGTHEKLVRQPLHREVTSLGTQRTVQEGVRYDFAPDGRITVAQGQDILADGPLVRGEDGMLRNAEQDAIDWLRGHRLLNERFWEEGREPDRPLPTEEDFLALVTDAMRDLDADKLEGALTQERGTHNRPVLVKTAEGALGKVRETLAAARRAQDERARQEQAAAKSKPAE